MAKATETPTQQPPSLPQGRGAAAVLQIPTVYDALGSPGTELRDTLRAHMMTLANKGESNEAIVAAAREWVAAQVDWNAVTRRELGRDLNEQDGETIDHVLKTILLAARKGR